MISFYISQQDLLETRFAYSPLWETVNSFRALQNPARHALYLDWIRQTEALLEPQWLRILEAVVPAEGYLPDFLTPPPTTPLPDFGLELASLRKTPLATVKKDALHLKGILQKRGDVPAKLEAFIATPAEALQTLCDALEQYWQASLKPHWSRMQAVLEGDILYRSKQLAFGGMEALFANLHPTISFHENTLRIEKRHKESVTLGGRGLLLVPIIFGYPEPLVLTNSPRQPVIGYHPRGAGLWSGDVLETSESMRLTLGKTRAQVIARLKTPLTTRELAKQLDLSPAATSQQLGRLKRAGLLETYRDGREVFYRLSSVGSRVLAAFDE